MDETSVYIPSERLTELSLDAAATFTSAGPAAGAPAMSLRTLAKVTVAAATEVAEGGGVSGSPRAEGATFILREKLGAGGMGEVFEAEQVSLGRTVAVKRIRRDRLRGSDLERTRAELEFRFEAQIAARLEHPNIVPVHDLAAAEDGMPLIAMKLVHGQPWDRILKADFERLSEQDFLAKHLQILSDVSQAVAFAHSRGIVHRDLKPAQVMVGEFGEVLLMDWGLALFVGDPERSADVRGEDLPTRAIASSPSGTPALMAPEQTERDASKIGPWTDVFLLGGTLYHILTGTYPHQADSAAHAMARAAAGIVEDPRERAPQRDIPAALAELCNRALARDPQERFADGRAFHEALSAYLSGATKRREALALLETARARVQASPGDYEELSEALAELHRALSLWPESRDIAAESEATLAKYAAAALAAGDLRLARVQAERLRSGRERDALLARVAEGERDALRAARTRRFALVSTFVLMALVLVGGSAFSLSLSRAKNDAESARDAAQRERDIARATRGRADELVSFIVRDLGLRLAPTDPKLGALRDALTKSVEYLYSVDRSVLTQEEFERLVNYGSEIAGMLLAQGRAEESEALAVWVLEVSREGIARFPRSTTIVSRMGYGWNHAALAQAQRLGPAYALDDAQRGANELLEVSRRAGMSRDPQILRTLSALYNRVADGLNAKGQAAEAFAAAMSSLEVMNVAVELEPDNPQLARDNVAAVSFVAGLANVAGRNEEALAALDEADALLERLLALEGVKESAARALRMDRVTLMKLRSDLYTSIGKAELGEEGLREAAEMMEELVALDRSNVSYRIELAGCRIRLTWSLVQRGALAEAEVEAGRCLETIEGLPANADVLRLRARTLARLAEISARRADYEAQRDYAREVVELYRRNLALDANDRRSVGDLSSALATLGNAHASLDEVEDALAATSESVVLARENAAHAPENASIQRDFHIALNQLANALGQVHRFDEAAAVAEESYRASLAMHERYPTNALLRRDVMSALSYRYPMLRNAGHFEEALSVAQEMRERCALAAEESPTPANIIEDSYGEMNLGGAYNALWRWADALPHHRRAIELLAPMRERFPNEVSLHSRHSAIHDRYALALLMTGDRDGCFDAVAQRLESNAMLRALAPKLESHAADAVEVQRQLAIYAWLADDPETMAMAIEDGDAALEEVSTVLSEAKRRELAAMQHFPRLLAARTSDDAAAARTAAEALLAGLAESDEYALAANANARAIALDTVGRREEALALLEEQRAKRNRPAAMEATLLRLGFPGSLDPRVDPFPPPPEG